MAPTRVKAEKQLSKASSVFARAEVEVHIQVAHGDKERERKIAECSCALSTTQLNSLAHNECRLSHNHHRSKVPMHKGGRLISWLTDSSCIHFPCRECCLTILSLLNFPILPHCVLVVMPTYTTCSDSNNAREHVPWCRPTQVRQYQIPPLCLYWADVHIAAQQYRLSQLPA